jgi:hypothetical protein
LAFAVADIFGSLNGPPGISLARKNTTDTRTNTVTMDIPTRFSIYFFIGSRSFNYGNIPNPVVPAAGYGSFIRQAATGYVLRFRNPAALPDPEAQVLQSSSKVFQYVLDR